MDLFGRQQYPVVEQLRSILFKNSLVIVYVSLQAGLLSFYAALRRCPVLERRNLLRAIPQQGLSAKVSRDPALMQAVFPQNHLL